MSKLITVLLLCAAASGWCTTVLGHRLSAAGRHNHNKLQHKPQLQDNLGKNGRGGPLDDLRDFHYNPQSNPSTFVVVGNARFTVLSPQLIRAQYASNTTTAQPAFEDRSTLMAVNRYQTNPANFTTHTDSEGYFYIKTDSVELKYKTGEPFAPSTLGLTLSDGRSWSYGEADDGNLFGTIRSLDGQCTISLNCTLNANILINGEENHCAFGMVSRNGWAVVNDTANFLMVSEADNPNDNPAINNDNWFGPNVRATDAEDLYLFGHGNDFRKAIKDYTSLAGRTPIPRRQMFGSWFTRWFDYANTDIEVLIGNFESYGLPLDVLVIDMNWHTKNDWTGYSWDKQLYPIPKDTIDFLRHKNLLFSLNLHDADGVGFWEDQYNAMCQHMGQNADYGLPVPFQPLNKTYFHGLDDIVLDAIGGADIWWIDWQQGGLCTGGCNGYQLNPTFLTDHVRSTDNMRRGKDTRDAILARWGGLGGHRYPVGFTGDVQYVDWECFAFQPYFSATAANVAHGTLSHDLMGPYNDHELHVRWMQFGAYSGVMRIHDRGGSAGSCWPNCDIVDLWMLPPEYFAPIRDVMLARVALLPYMYTHARATFEDGLPLMYPMYYDNPTNAEAYKMDQTGVYAQYMFGPQILVAPITQQVSTTNGVVSKTIWLPPGQWWDDVFGRLVTAPSVTGLSVTNSYALFEVPLYVKAGAIIPRIPNPAKVGAASEPFHHYDLHIYPGGSGSGSYTLYDDDGQTYSYISSATNPDSVAYTDISYTRSSSTTITVTIAASTSAVSGLNRTVRIILVGSQPIAAAKVTTGATTTEASYSRFDKDHEATFSYDGVGVTAVYHLGLIHWNETAVAEITLAASQVDASFAGLKGFGIRSLQAKHATDNYRVTPSSTIVGWGFVKEAASRGGLLTALANPSDAPTTAFQSLLGASYSTLLSNAIAEYQGTLPPVPGTMLPALVQLWDDERKDMCLCGCYQCLEDNNYYQVMWAEGFQAQASGAPSSVPFFDYYNNGNDNWGDVVASPPSGYSAADFPINGYVLPSDTTTTDSKQCLQVWYNSATGDHMTTATAQGIQFAQENQYTLLKSCIGYTLTNATSLENTVSKKKGSYMAHLQEEGEDSISLVTASSSDVTSAALEWARSIMTRSRESDARKNIHRRELKTKKVGSMNKKRANRKVGKGQRLADGIEVAYAEALLSTALSGN